MTQGLWRDEAFSVLMAEKPLSFIMTHLGFEPPVYYVLLHGWIRLFGSSDISVKILSLIGYVLATWVVIEWGAQMFKKHWLSFFLPVFFFFNPMLLYYAFEVRTYAWYAFFSVGMLYAYSTKRWNLFIAAAVLGFYTHVYIFPYFCAIVLHWFITEKPWKRSSVKKVFSTMAFRSIVIIFAFMLPWLIRIVFLTNRLSQSWYFPADIRLIYSALGNIFTGYEGTPWYGWRYTKYLSFFILCFSLLSASDKKHRYRNMLYLLFGYVPLAVIIGISFLQPLYVVRYMIPTVIAEILIITTALAAMKNTLLSRFLAGILLLFTFAVNFWIPEHHKKIAIRETVGNVHMLLEKKDVILAEDALIFLETLFYAKDRNTVYVINPMKETVPWYIGNSLITQDRMISEYPEYPRRAFLIHKNGSFDVVYRIPM